ncbi:unnamed protein product [Rotaria sordida]|uniref:Peptidase M12A domain-containing protein n=1 Tax=Rotaria sordida TaxID=392033 RepID=A0A815LUM7_9BILA|nr:unnamed protein product [Rotaria sordida]CAF1414974.1 unnamed protein product [Rotaria sordida]
MGLFYDHTDLLFAFRKRDNTEVDTQNTPYDYYSLLHYRHDAFTKNGLDTIVPLQSGVVLAEPKTLSAIDIQKVRLFYGCDGTGITLPPTTEPDGFNPNIYYRLTTQWQGDGKSLDIINDGTNNKPILAATAALTGQYWKITSIGNGYYRLTTQWQGDGKSLDIINDGTNNRPILAATGALSGQYWKITPIGNGYYRLTTQWQGDGKSLDIVNDGTNNRPILAATGAQTGQYWKISAV